MTCIHDGCINYSQHQSIANFFQDKSLMGFLRWFHREYSDEWCVDGSFPTIQDPVTLFSPCSRSDVMLRIICSTRMSQQCMCQWTRKFPNNLRASQTRIIGKGLVVLAVLQSCKGFTLLDTLLLFGFSLSFGCVDPFL
eukprot:2576910-Amphidinium_carterae.2